MKKVANYAEQVLNENYSSFVSRWNEQNPNDEPYTIAEWCEIQAENDPDFYRWLFSDHDISDFGSDLSTEDLKVAADFFEIL
jgi:hypothetical protein